MRQNIALALSLAALITGPHTQSLGPGGAEPQPAGSADRPAGLLAAYAANRGEGVGNYITHDLILRGHELCLEEATLRAEETIYLPLLVNLVSSLGDRAKQGPEMQFTKADRQFLQVLGALLDGTSGAAGAVQEEVKRVRASEGFSRSSILPETLDYSQFRIRGSYTRTPLLSRYFQAVRYGGTVLFAVKASAATGIDSAAADQLTSQALQLAGWIQSSPVASKAYSAFLNQTNLLFGAPDDLSLEELLSVRASSSLAEQRSRLLSNARASGSQPQILGGLVDVAKLEPGVTAEDVLTGWRLFPQHRSVDGPLFRNLVFDRVGEYKGTGQPRSMDTINGKKVKAFPLALEIPALLGSDQAIKELDASDERNYDGYAVAFSKARTLMGVSPAPASWLPVIKALLASPADGEVHQRIATALAFWTTQKHRGLLYEKQAYTPVAKSVEVAPNRTAAYLEPSTDVYRALLAQTAALAPAFPGKQITSWTTMLQRCIDIADREISGAALTNADVDFLNDLDTWLVSEAGRDDSPIVVDVHTNPSSQQALEEAVGYPIFVECKTKRGQTLRGARLTHFEFRQPMDQRMTDEEWQIRARTWGQEAPSSSDQERK